MKQLIFVIIILFTVVSFLFSPKPFNETDYCGTYIKISNRSGFIKNCDTKYSINPALHPGILLKKNTIRQSRPLYILTGTIFGYSLNTLLQLIGFNPYPEAIFYLGFVLINFLTLYFGIILYDKILAAFGVDKFLLFTSSLFLICNDVTKSFFWTPHQQMFNMFTPLLMIYIMSRILLAPCIISNRKFLLISFLSGILLLVYGNFVLILPCLLLSYTYRLYIDNNINPTRLTIAAILSVILFLIPTLCWVAIVTLTAGHYYNHAIAAYRQLVWIFDTLQLSLYEFARYFKHFSLKYFNTFSFEILPFVIMTIILWCHSYMQGRKNESTLLTKEDHTYAMMIKTYFTSFSIIFLFYWILGFYSNRLTFTVVPPLLCYISFKLDRIIKTNPHSGNMVKIIITICAIFWFVYHVVKYGPFS